jgi:DnaJ-class molecular chaperone
MLHILQRQPMLKLLTRSLTGPGDRHGHIRAAKILLGLGLSSAARNSVAIDIDQKELRNRYYALAKQCHPDSAEVANKDAEKFNALAEAYALLSGRAKQLHECVTAATEQRPEHRPTGSQHQHSAHTIWSALFFGTVLHEVQLDAQSLEEILAASALEQGGLDKGGMWELVRNMKMSHEHHCRDTDAPSSQAVSAFLHSSSNSSSSNSSSSNPHTPTPARRKSRKKKDPL